jgi:hypothetical protein
MTVTQVASIFRGVKGHVETRSVGGGFGEEIRSYRTCQAYSNVTIGFSKNPGGQYRVDNKEAIWTY